MTFVQLGKEARVSRDSVLSPKGAITAIHVPRLRSDSEIERDLHVYIPKVVDCTQDLVHWSHDLDVRMWNMNDSVMGVFSEHDERLDAHDASIEVLTERTADLQKRVTHAHGRASDLNVLIARLDSRLGQLQGEILIHDADGDSLQTELVGVSQRLATLETAKPTKVWPLAMLVFLSYFLSLSALYFSLTSH